MNSLQILREMTSIKNWSVKADDPVISDKNKRKKKKKTGSDVSRDISKIEEILKALVSSGLIEKNRHKFLKKSGFTFESKLKINRSGDAIAKYREQDIIIHKTDIDNARNDDVVTVKIYDYRRGFFSGRVLKVGKRNKDSNIAHVIGKTGTLTIFRLLDVHGDVNVCTQKKGKEPVIGDFATITLGEKRISGMSECTVLEYFGEDDEKCDFIRIKNRHSLPDDHEYFKESEEDITVPDEELENRKDYTKLFTITIDGDTAKDFDDAISIKENKKSTKIYVHIADVSAYVRAGTKLDQEAYHPRYQLLSWKQGNPHAA